MARSTRTEETTAVDVADAPVATDELDAIEEISYPSAAAPAPDARLVDRLRLSEKARTESGTATGFSFKVNGEAALKTRIKELRTAGGPDYANCGVGIKTQENGDGTYTIYFKARQRRGTGSQATNQATS